MNIAIVTVDGSTSFTTCTYTSSRGFQRLKGGYYQEFEPPKTAKERTSTSYRNINRAAAVVIDSVVVIARVQSGLTVTTIHGIWLPLAWQCGLCFNVTTRIT